MSQGRLFVNDEGQIECLKAQKCGFAAVVEFVFGGFIG